MDEGPIPETGTYSRVTHTLGVELDLLKTFDICTPPRDTVDNSLVRGAVRRENSDVIIRRVNRQTVELGKRGRLFTANSANEGPLPDSGLTGDASTPCFEKILRGANTADQRGGSVRNERFGNRAIKRGER